MENRRIMKYQISFEISKREIFLLLALLSSIIYIAFFASVECPECPECEIEISSLPPIATRPPIAKPQNDTVALSARPEKTACCQRKGILGYFLKHGRENRTDGRKQSPNPFMNRFYAHSPKFLCRYHFITLFNEPGNEPECPEKDKDKYGRYSEINEKGEYLLRLHFP